MTSATTEGAAASNALEEKSALNKLLFESSSKRSSVLKLVQAWERGRAVDAFAVLAEEFTHCSQARSALASLRKVIPVGPDKTSSATLESQQAEARVRLSEATRAISETEEYYTKERLTWLASEADKNPRLSWLAAPVERARIGLEANEPLQVAVLGVFNAGKSSLINAIVGHEILRTGIVPVTACLTELRYGSSEEVKVLFTDGTERACTPEELAGLTDERENRDPSHTVERVTLFYPSEFLKKFTLLDTPGFNSGFDMHDMVTERVIQSADVVLWVFNATKAGSETELRELGHVERSVGKAIGIVNHVDAIDPSHDRDALAWRRELDGVLEDLSTKLGDLISSWVPVSAKWISENHPESGQDRLFQSLQAMADRSAEIRAAAGLKHARSLARTALALSKLQEEERESFRKCEQALKEPLALQTKNLRADLTLEIELLSAKNKLGSPAGFTLDSADCELASAILALGWFDMAACRACLHALQAFCANIALLESPLGEVWSGALRRAAVADLGRERPRHYWTTIEGDYSVIGEAAGSLRHGQVCTSVADLLVREARYITEGIRRERLTHAAQLFSPMESVSSLYTEESVIRALPACAQWLRGGERIRRFKVGVLKAQKMEQAGHLDAALNCLSEVEAHFPEKSAEIALLWPVDSPLAKARRSTQAASLINEAKLLSATKAHGAALACLLRALQIDPVREAELQMEMAGARAALQAQEANDAKLRRDLILEKGARLLANFQPASPNARATLDQAARVLGTHVNEFPLYGKCQAKLARRHMWRRLSTRVALAVLLWALLPLSYLLWNYRSENSAKDRAGSSRDAASARSPVVASDFLPTVGDEHEEAEFREIATRIRNAITVPDARAARSAYARKRHATLLDEILAARIREITGQPAGPAASQTPEEDAYRLAVDAIDAAKTEAQVDAAVRFYEWNCRKVDIEEHALARRIFLKDERAAFASFMKIAEAQTDTQVEAAVRAYVGSHFHEEVRRRADLRLAWLKERAAALEAKESVASAKSVKDAHAARERYTGSEFKDDLDQCLAAALIRIDDREYEIALNAVREARNPEKAHLARKTYGGSRRAKELDEVLSSCLDVLSANACESAIASAKSASAAEDARKSYSGKERRDALDKKLAARLDEIETQSCLDAQSFIKAAKTSRAAREARARYAGTKKAAELDKLLRDRLWQLAVSAGSFTEHTNDVTCATFSPDSKYVLTGSDDETLRLWDAATRREIRKLEKPMSNITCAAFAQSREYSIAGCDNGCVYVWVTQSGKLAATWKMGDDVLCIATSASGDYALVGGKKKLGAVLVDIRTGKILRKFQGHTDDVRSIALSPNEEYCVTASDDKTARVWEIESGDCVNVFRGHTDYVRAASFSPDGKFVATASDDKTARLWRISTGASIRTFIGHTDYVRSIAFSPDGRYVLTGGDDKTARLWDASNADEIRSFTGHTGAVRTVAFSPDGLLILSGGTDNSARLWAWRD